MTIWGICGIPASGKTLFLTMLVKKYYDNGFECLTNYNTKFSKYIDVMDLLSFKLSNCFIGLQECWSIMDSRMSGTDSNRLLSYLMVQLRHLDIHLGFDSQMLGMVDLRLRQIANYVIYCDRKEYGFHYTYYYGQSFIPIMSKSLTFKECEQKGYYNWYNTKELSDPIDFMTRKISIDKIKKMFEKSPNQKSFITLFKIDYPFISQDNISSIYSFAKNNDYNTIKKILERV